MTYSTLYPAPMLYAPLHGAITTMTYSPLDPNTTMTYANPISKSLRHVLAALLLLVSLGLMATQTASAQVPQRLAYQSLVSDQDGDFLRDGAYQVTFRLYNTEDASGEALWSETQTVAVTDGLLSTFIGAEKALDLPFDQPYYLSVQLDDQPESQPLPLSTAAYALKARDVVDGAVVRSISGLKDDVDLVAGDGISLETRDNQLVISAAYREPGLTGYGPVEAAAKAAGGAARSAFSNAVRQITQSNLSLQEQEKALDQLASTLGPDGSNVGLDAAYDDGSWITLDAGAVVLQGSDHTNGLVVRDSDLLIRDGIGGNPEFRFRVDDPEQVWLLSVDATTSTFGFSNKTDDRTPLWVSKTATDSLLTLEESALTLRDALGSETIRLDANYQSSGTSRITVDEVELKGGSDLAERFEIDAAVTLPQPGMVVSIDASRPGSLRVSDQAYDAMVAGVVSGAGGVKPGLLMGQSGTLADGAHPVALTGRVYVWVDAAYGSVAPGDLLTTSETAGHAMKASDVARRAGSILGKAMTSLPEGRGLVLMLVTLQ